MPDGEQQDRHPASAFAQATDDADAAGWEMVARLEAMIPAKFCQRCVRVVPFAIRDRQSKLDNSRGGIAQLVERQLCKLEVRGSNPLASSPESFRGCRAVALAKADIFSACSISLASFHRRF